ncbi:hypothetical protein EYF80_018991 [Liparis tanakae]|uniref:Uncharacterized protein n=1 Tax=Liparis tanakae TaxID=230148 RepID=A0A4Z2HYH0_9TELE|nr:hypothetical protein EYF80_018991 [Liparis tanakae]
MAGRRPGKQGRPRMLEAAVEVLKDDEDMMSAISGCSLSSWDEGHTVRRGTKRQKGSSTSPTVMPRSNKDKTGMMWGTEVLERALDSVVTGEVFLE